MAYSGSMKIPKELGIQSSHGFCNPHANVMVKSHLHTVGINFSSRALRQDCWSLHVLSRVHKPTSPAFCRCNLFLCQSVLTPVGNEAPIVKSATVILTRLYDVLQASFKSSLLLKLIPAVGTMAFAAWGLGPLMRFGRTFFLRSSDSGWEKSNTNDITTSYIQPLLLWAGATLLCRALDQIALPSVAGEVVKQRVLTFVRSLSTVLAFAYCLSSLIQQAQKFVTETNEPNDARNMGFSFAAKAVYTAVWVAGASLFMELLGFSTQRWLTAGGLGTVLLTLAGREIFTNFLSSLMIHATRPFVVGEWIQTKIQGYEVSGTVEHVGWWSPTIIRADDREAVHIPNHKFTVNIVRNLSQKTHWRIKTHLAISHMDVSKINNIVADMRKVLAKNPQVEQQKLHRRVFLENINPENQALMILVSCFVKTSHIEEYLCVKEEILLDLHRVISHHRARLATPIRTVRKVYGEADLENIPFSGANVGHAGTGFSRPFLLIEPSSKIRAEDKSKASTRPVSRNVEEKAYSITVDKVDTDATSASDLGSKSDDMMKAPVNLNSGATSEISTTSDPKIQISSSDGSVPYVTEIQDQPEKKNSGNAWTEKMAPNPELKSPGNVTNNTHISISSKSGTENINISSAVSPMKQDNEKAVTSSSVSSSSLEDNIVLGVALEGSKRTLPIEDEVDAPPTLTESNDSTGKRNGSESAIVGSNKEDVHRG